MNVSAICLLVHDHFQEVLHASSTFYFTSICFLQHSAFKEIDCLVFISTVSFNKLIIASKIIHEFVYLSYFKICVTKIDFGT